MTGAALPVKGGIVLDLAGLDGAETVDDVNLTVTVPAGVLGSDLEARLNARGLTLGHSPQSLGCSSVGGWLATRASGQFSSKYGSIEDLVLGVTAVLSSGRRVTLTTSPRAALGPDLRQLFIGSEGTLAVITEVVLRIFPVPQHRVLEAFRFDDVTSGIEAMRQITRQGLRPFLVRFYDEDEARHAMQDVGFDGCVLFLGHEGLAALAACEHGLAVEIVERCGATSLGSTAVEAWMLRRFDFSTVEKALNKTGGYAETIEVAQEWRTIEALYRDLKRALQPLADEVLGHFSHVYNQGTSLYVILLGHADDDAEVQSRLEEIWRVAMETTLQHGGQISHHHGVGLAREGFMEQAAPDSVALLREIKKALDPAGILNPGKLGI